MTEKTERNLPKIVGFLILMFPGFLIRFGLEAFRLKHRAYKAARIFRRELYRHGLDSTTTQRLTESYMEGSDPFTLLRALR